ncbi:MAG: response regulator transcription factor [Pseudomonadota bacterium]
MPHKILIVDDHPIFSEALRDVVADAFPNGVVVAAETLREAIELICSHGDWDLVLLDLWLPDTHGFTGLIELRRRFSKLPIVVVSAFADHGVVHKAVVCGAAGFIPKSAGKETLLRAIREVLAGDVALPADYVPPTSAACKDLATLTSRLRSLTRQQLRVLHMLCQGLLNKQIAHQLEVGETTVKAHVSEILRKLSVNSRTQAVLEVSKLDLGAVLALYGGEDASTYVNSAQ